MSKRIQSMKFTCTQENLAHGLTSISRVAGKNAALPILNNVLIKAAAGVVRLSTTNLELGLTATIRAKIEKEGSYTVQSRVLHEFVGLLGNEKVTLELTDQGLLVTSGHTKTTLKGLPADEFPVLPTIQSTVSIEVEGKTLHRLLEGVVFSVANDESRPEISGVLIQCVGNKIVVTATDSYRLAERRAKLTAAVSKEVSVILPARTADELLRAIPENATISLAINENQIFCQTPDLEIISRTIEGHYPDYQQIIPTTSSSNATIPKEELINNIRAASLFCKPGINDITLSLDPVTKTLALAAANTSVGEHQSQLTGEVEGQALTIVFNYRYLLEGVQSLEGNSVRLELQDAQAPGVLRPTTKAEDLYLLMPIRQ